MGAMTSQITSLTIVHSTVYSGADQRKHQSSGLLTFVRVRSPVNSPHKWAVTRKMFPFYDVIMVWYRSVVACSTLVQSTMAWRRQATSHDPLPESMITQDLWYQMWLIYWCPSFLSRHCNAFEDGVPADEFFGYPIFTWVTVTWQAWEVSRW